VITLNCDACGKKLQIRDEFAGQTGQCPACGFTLPIPDPQAPNDEALPAEVVAIVEPEPAPPQSHVPVLPPPEGTLLDHGGRTLPDQADFFASVPLEIGPLRSAYTTLLQGQQPKSMGSRLLFAGAMAGLGVVLGLLIDKGFSVRNEFWAIAWPTVLSLLAFGISMAATGFSHTCTYVGTDGVARFVCSGSRENLATQEVFRFRDATDLRTATTLHYTNGVYQNTSYSFTWTDINGRSRHVISGSHNSEAGTPKSTDYFLYGKAAETAWTVYLFDNANRHIKLGNTVQFNLTGGQWLRLGPGLLVLNTAGQQEEWRAEDIRGATIHKGVVRILRNDAKEGWFSSKGVHKFSFDQLANAQLFFHMMEKVVGVPVN
jgi:hypothetical protein